MVNFSSMSNPGKRKCKIILSSFNTTIRNNKLLSMVTVHPYLLLHNHGPLLLRNGLDSLLPTAYYSTRGTTRGPESKSVHTCTGATIK
jgi:hypothetical protein